MKDGGGIDRRGASRAPLGLEEVLDEAQLAGVVLDAHGRVAYCNPHLAALLGRSRAEVVGADWIGAIVAADLRDETRRLFARVAREPVGSFTHEVEVERPGGERRRLRWTTTVLRERDGAFAGVACIGEDVTERRRAAEAHRLARAALESSGTAMAIGDADARLVYVNPAFLRLWGYAREEEVLGRSALEFWADPAAAEASARGIARDGRWTGELVARRVDGGEATLGVDATHFSDPETGTVRMIATFQDLTELRRAEEQLRQAQKMEAVGALAGGIAHDFNNMLTVILSVGSVALEGLPPGDPTRADLEEIVATARRAESLTRQILSFARRQLTQPVALDLNATIADAARMIRRIIGEHIVVRHALEPDLPPVVADARDLEQVLLNLAVNARDAMPGGGSVEISTRRLARRGGREERERVELVVRDSGVGMDGQTRARAFDPFFTTKPAGQGTGLGLAVVHGIVQQCGGSVRLDSAPGRGTAVVIELPAAGPDARPAAARAPEAPRAAGSAAPGRTVLVVEDQAPVRGIAVRCLEGAGYRVLQAAGGEEALRLAVDAPCLDLLLTDVVMPGLGGAALAERLRAERPGLRVLFMSGFSASLPEALAPAGGCLVAKPFTPDVLLARVAEALERAPAAARGPGHARGA